MAPIEERMSILELQLTICRAELDSCRSELDDLKSRDVANPEFESVTCKRLFVSGGAYINGAI